ncbi:MAG: TonB-dependent receptor [Cyclobacteriaceae bacterium]
MKIIQFLLIISITLIAGINSHGQSLSGRILDINTDEPIVGALIISLPDSNTTISSESGEFTITTGDSWFISMLGYDQVKLKAVDKKTIKLTPSIYNLKQVVVRGPASPISFDAYAGGVSIKTMQQLDNLDQSIITSSLNSLPGVYMQSGALNTNRITIRGIGARSPFSTNKIKAYFGDIPLTDGSGETTLEDIDMSNIGTIEVLKGPNASIYGNGLGGVINLTPKNSNKNERSIRANGSIGSFGLFRSGFGYADNTERSNFSISINQQKSAGYRANNEFNRKSIFLTDDLNADRNKVSLLFYAVDQKAGIPSALNQDDFENEPTKAAFTWNQSQGYEDYFKMLTGATLERKLNASGYIKTSLFANYRNAYEARPFNILKESVAGIGLRSSLALTLTDKVNLTQGFELYADQYQWNTYENLYRQNNGNGSLLGNILSDFAENRYYANLFGEFNYQLSRQLNAQIGYNLNSTGYQLDDYFANDSIDYSGKHSFDPTLSPRFSLFYYPTQNITSFFSLSHGFSPPSVEETLLPSGAVNTDLQPETGWNAEIGTRYQQTDRLWSAISIYTMSINNLLVAETLGSGEWLARNAGNTQHNGVELETRWLLLNQRNLIINTEGSYSFSSFHFSEFDDGGMDYSGNKLTGVPQHQSAISVDAKALEFVQLGLAHQYVGTMPMNDANEIFNPAYQLINGWIKLEKMFFNELTCSIGFRTHNLLNEKYASMISINATGFGGNAPRYYYPGLPRNHQATFSLVWSLNR